MGKGRITSNSGDGFYGVDLLKWDPAAGDVVYDSVTAACADYTTDIPFGTEVGMAETGGTGFEYRSGSKAQINIIKPGYDSAEWDSADGQKQAVTAPSEAGYFYNAGLQPGWQKWMPTYRTGKILSINYDADTATVCVRPAYDPMLGSNLEPETLPECNLGEPDPGDDYHMQQLYDFCERNSEHPACQVIDARENVSHDDYFSTIESINTTVNQGMSYRRDENQDRWNSYTSMPATGDCEDYALSKMALLEDAGIPAEAMGLAVGKTGSGPTRGSNDIDHAWAVVFTDKGMLHLDQAPNKPSGRQPGTNFRILRYSEYDIVARKLVGVPIEYMSCNSGAFLFGDDVLIEFEGQSWNSPKIIGFATGPKLCGYLLEFDFINEVRKVAAGSDELADSAEDRNNENYVAFKACLDSVFPYSNNIPRDEGEGFFKSENTFHTIFNSNWRFDKNHIRAFEKVDFINVLSENGIKINQDTNNILLTEDIDALLESGRGARYISAITPSEGGFAFESESVVSETSTDKIIDTGDALPTEYFYAIDWDAYRETCDFYTGSSTICPVVFDKDNESDKKLFGTKAAILSFDPAFLKFQLSCLESRSSYTYWNEVPPTAGWGWFSFYKSYISTKGTWTECGIETISITDFPYVTIDEIEYEPYQFICVITSSDDDYSLSDAGYSIVFEGSNKCAIIGHQRIYINYQMRRE